MSNKNRNIIIKFEFITSIKDNNFKILPPKTEIIAIKINSKTSNIVIIIDLTIFFIGFCSSVLYIVDAAIIIDFVPLEIKKIADTIIIITLKSSPLPCTRGTINLLVFAGSDNSIASTIVSIEIEKIGDIIPKTKIIGKIDNKKKNAICPGNICITGFFIVFISLL